MPLTQRIIQNFHLVWLDGNIKENDDDCRNFIEKLKQVVNTVNTFVDVDECIDFISTIPEETVFMITSGALTQTTVSVIDNMTQISGIYIFGGHEAPYEEWPKVKGIFTNIQPICEALKQAAQDCDQNAVSISFASTGDPTTDIANKNTLHCSFMYTQILKDILLTIDFNHQHIMDFIKYFRIELSGNSKQLKIVDQIENEYRDHEPIWWYTRQTFLYSMLNRALRLMDVDIIIQMGFFVCDLHKNIADLHSKQFYGQTSSQSFIVYRGQSLSQTDFHQLKQNQGGLLAFNNFLSTSKNRNTSLNFIKRNLGKNELASLLFVIGIDPSIQSTPFADIAKISAIGREEEILFSMHSVFRIGKIKQFPNNPQIWEVELTLTDDNDPRLRELSKTIQEETSGSTGWNRLGQLLIKLAKFDKAEALYEILLKQTTDQKVKANIFHQLGLINDNQGEYSKALEYCEKSLEIYKKTLPANHPDLATSYNNIGSVYDHMGEYSKALEYYEKSLEIRKKTLPANHRLLATSYNNIGNVYDSMGEYSKALESYGKSLEIEKKSLPANHPLFATSYNNIGNVYDRMGEYSKALEYYEKSLEIRKKTLSTNHPDVAASYNNIGLVYDHIGEYSKALEYFEKSLEIYKKTLPANHPHLAASYNNIGNVYDRMGEYSKALEYYEKSLEIRKKTLPANHPDLATSCNNIGLVYDHIGEYSKALEYFEKSLEIYKKTLPANHPSLATSYNNIGLVYNSMSEYSKALEYYEKSLEIRKKTLPANHPSLATSYNNIGLVYNSMGEYSKALESYEKSLEIEKKTLPANHPSLATSYNNIGLVYNSMGEYSKALEYFEKSLEVWKKTLPVNHPLFATSYNNIGSVYNSMDEYSKALEYYEKSLEIRKKTLPANHPDVAASYNNIACVYTKKTDYKKALDYFDRALVIWQRSLPSNHPNIQCVKQSIDFVKKEVVTKFVCSHV